MPPLCSSSDSETLELGKAAGRKTKPEDMGASKGKGKDKGTETGKGKRKKDWVYSRYGCRGPPESSDDSEDLEGLTGVNPFRDYLVLLADRKGKVKGKGKGKDKDKDSLQGPPRSQP